MSDLNTKELHADIIALTEEVKAIKTLLEELRIIYEQSLNNSGK
jgi:hypothetical protein